MLFDSFDSFNSFDFRLIGTQIQVMGSHCNSCSSKVSEQVLGKLCVRFGAVIRQFCSSECLEKFKARHKLCSQCQINMLNKEQVTETFHQQNHEFDHSLFGSCFVRKLAKILANVWKTLSTTWASAFVPFVSNTKPSARRSFLKDWATGSAANPAAMLSASHTKWVSHTNLIAHQHVTSFISLRIVAFEIGNNAELRRLQSILWRGGSASIRCEEAGRNDDHSAQASGIVLVLQFNVPCHSFAQAAQDRTVQSMSGEKVQRRHDSQVPFTQQQQGSGGNQLYTMTPITMIPRNILSSSNISFSMSVCICIWPGTFLPKAF